MVQVTSAPVVGVRAYPNGDVLLALHAPPIASRCRPGQFVMAAPLQREAQPFPLLKRALVVYSTDFPEVPDKTVIGLLLKVVGEGTRKLAALRAGDKASLIGPLGNGFELESARGRISLLTAGGIGIASFYLLAQSLKAAGQKVVLVYGARSKRDLTAIEDFEALGIPVYATTDDGSYGLRGMVAAGLRRAAADRSGLPLTVFACGPNAMMRATAEWSAQRGIPCFISVENRMACGFGVCLGCTVETAAGYRLACTHGPVFDARTIRWPEGQSASAVSGGVG